MAESSRDTQTQKTDADKKQPETVQLTAEELKSIAGGITHGGGTPPAAKDLTRPTGVKGV